MMNPDTIENYLERIYGYAIRHTYSQEEADELSQEIAVTVVRELPKLRDDGKFEPWLWGVASNVTKSYRRHKGKQRAMYSYDALDTIPYEEEYPSENEELYDFLRRKIAMLSAMYRDIIILYYYDGLSTSQIADTLKIPEGTVTWRLSEARKKLKKELEQMTETALRPITMKLNIYGCGDYNGDSIPFPTVYIDDALSQNILYYCYEEAKGVEELSKLCGTPAYYIEERLQNLLKREAVIEVSKGKYRTDFIIWSDKYGIYCEENAENALMPMMEKLLNALDGIAGEAAKIDFYKAEKSETDLYYLYGALAFSYAREHYCTLPYPWFKKKRDGYEWCYLGNMETGKHQRFQVGIQQNKNLGGRGRYSHTVYHAINGIAYRPMMYDRHINVCEDILYNGSSEDVDSVAQAIQGGYIVKKPDGSFCVTVPAFTKEQKATLDAIIERYLSPLMPEYDEIVAQFVAGYKKLFPKHLSDDADRMCQSIFVGFYATVIAYAQRIGRIPLPSPHCFCDVLLQFK